MGMISTNHNLWILIKKFRRLSYSNTVLANSTRVTHLRQNTTKIDPLISKSVKIATIYLQQKLRFQLYLSNQTSIKRLCSTFWIANKRFISKVIQMTSSYQTVPAIVSWATYGQYAIIVLHIVDLSKSYKEAYIELA